MKKLIIVGLAFVAFGLQAQEAHVIALKPEDAAHARCTWERLQKAQKEWDQVQEDIKNEYVVAPTGNGGNVNLFPAVTWKKGFESGFQFSEDFKYIVPKTSNTITLNGSTLIPGWSGQCWIMDSNGGHYGSCGTTPVN